MPYNGISGICQQGKLFILQLSEAGWRKTGDPFELAGEMCYAAVMHLFSDSRQREFLLDEQVFYPLDLMDDVILLDGYTQFF